MIRVSAGLRRRLIGLVELNPADLSSTLIGYLCGWQIPPQHCVQLTGSVFNTLHVQSAGKDYRNQRERCSQSNTDWSSYAGE